MASLDFDILGEVRAWRDGDELDLGSAKQRAVLAVLLLEANQPVSVNRIIDAVWGDEPPASGANVVQKYVGALRRALEPDRSPRAPGQVLARLASGYRLSVEPGHLDADAVTEQVRQAGAVAGTGDLTRAATMLADALARWRGEPLAGFGGPIFETARQRLLEQRAAAAELHADVLLRAGRHAEALPELTRLVVEYPYRERLTALHLEALYRAGRQTEALTAYAAARQRLVDENGVEPGAELRGVHERILRAEAAPEPAPSRPPIRVAPQSVYWGPEPERRGWRHWATRGAVVVVPLATFGVLTWLVMGLLAAWRRRWREAYFAVLYLAIVVTAIVAIPADAEHGSWVKTAIWVPGFLVSWLVGSAHVAYVVFGPDSSRPGPVGQPGPSRMSAVSSS